MYHRRPRQMLKTLMMLLESAQLEDGGSWSCGSHIADVAHYVKWDSPIDLEARMRTCSAFS